MAINHQTLPPLPLPSTITEDFIDCTATCGLTFHTIKCGSSTHPLILFCHGYPELAFSWRKVMPAIAAKGYYCVAMDQRGYGRTTGWPSVPYAEVDLNQYMFTNLVRDLVCLVYGMGFDRVFSIVGHDFGAVSSAMAALVRPDLFRSMVQLSHPYKAPASIPVSVSSGKDGDDTKKPTVDIEADLAQLNPPRKPYKWYNSTAAAASNWENPEQGLESFLRGYFHLKSANWAVNDPHPLKEWSADAIKDMPEYYVMRLEDTMPQTVARNMHGEDISATESWLSKADLQVYCQEWTRTGFQGALNWYRAVTASGVPSAAHDGLVFAGKRLEVPCVFISGAKDWGNYQVPGALDSYSNPEFVKEGCFRGLKFIDGAGHWVQQEQPERVIEELLMFLYGVEEEYAGKQAGSRT